MNYTSSIFSRNKGKSISAVSQRFAKIVQRIMVSSKPCKISYHRLVDYFHLGWSNQSNFLAVYRGRNVFLWLILSLSKATIASWKKRQTGLNSPLSSDLPRVTITGIVKDLYVDGSWSLWIFLYLTASDTWTNLVLDLETREYNFQLII